MTITETVLLLIGCAAVLAVLGPQRKRTNINPPPTFPRPPPPPAPPPVRNHRNADKISIWKELHRFADTSGLTEIETTLLGDVPWSMRDRIVTSHIPVWLAEDAKQHGFEIVAADWKRNCYTLRVVTPNA
jgi:hypothetical protein